MRSNMNMSTSSTDASKGHALSDDRVVQDDHSPGHHGGEHVQPLLNQGRKRYAEQNLPTSNPSSMGSVTSKRRCGSSRSTCQAGQLPSPSISPSTSPHIEFDGNTDLSGKKALEHPLFLLQRTLELTCNRADSALDVDSQATIETPDADVELAIAAVQANEDPMSSIPASPSGMIMINEDEVLNMGHQPAPAEQLQFRCSFPQGCNQWQSKIGASRKCISDKFGRNKKATRIILFARWCRSHYQQTSYKPSTANRTGLRAWGKMKIPLIRNALNAIERQQPGVLFNVILKKHEMDRLNRDNLNLDPPKASTDSYDSPLPVLRDFVNRGFIREHATRAQVNEILTWALDLLNRSVVDDCPCFEFIPVWSAESFKKWDWVRVLDKNIAKADREEGSAGNEQLDVMSLHTEVSGNTNRSNLKCSTQSETADVETVLRPSSVATSKADNKKGNPNLPVPPRVKKLLQAGRISKTGAIQKPASKETKASYVNRHSSA